MCRWSSPKGLQDKHTYFYTNKQWVPSRLPESWRGRKSFQRWCTRDIIHSGTEPLSSEVASSTVCLGALALLQLFFQPGFRTGSKVNMPPSPNLPSPTHHTHLDTQFKDICEWVMLLLPLRVPSSPRWHRAHSFTMCKLSHANTYHATLTGAAS